MGGPQMYINFSVAWYTSTRLRMSRYSGSPSLSAAIDGPKFGNVESQDVPVPPVAYPCKALIPPAGNHTSAGDSTFILRLGYLTKKTMTYRLVEEIQGVAKPWPNL